MIQHIEKTLRDHWKLPAYSDYQGDSYSYADVANHIVRLHLLFEEAGIRRGDRIAVCGPNSSRWGIAFMAIVSYGAVVVPILNDFQPEQIHHIVNHSETRLLFAAANIRKVVEPEQMPDLYGILAVEDFSLHTSTTGLQTAMESAGTRFLQTYPNGQLRVEQVKFEPEAVVNMEVRIDSKDPQTVPGEILARGKSVMLGYYKNPEATAEALDVEGWYHTGDLGLMDKKGNVFIRGRKKNMLLGPNGQNIYPEEIEDKLNSMLMVSESIVVQRNNRLEALIHPDYDDARDLGLTDENIYNILELVRKDLNEMLPAYEHIQAVNIQREEFEKTAKRSIKRHLYK